MLKLQFKIASAMGKAYRQGILRFVFIPKVIFRFRGSLIGY